MANKALFNARKRNPRADTVNEAGGIAYRFGPKQALAQYAATGCLNGTFYATAEAQFATVLALCEANAPEFIARAAIYARTKGFMKDLPALLCAVLSRKSPGLMAEIFDRVIDSPKMLRNFVQMMRGGAIGRRSLGTLPKRMIAQWLDKRTDEQLFTGSVGADPSLGDIIRLAHPKPRNAARAALYGWLIGGEYDAAALPEIVREFEAFKKRKQRNEKPLPDVPFQMLTGVPLSDAEWKQIALRASWQTTRMNLNTFLRHEVFEDRGVTETIAERIRDPEQIRKARVFPYQLLGAFKNASEQVPMKVRSALEAAMETAISNIPDIPGKVYVFPDVSGSMHSPVTGERKGATTKVRCVDVAALVAASMLRKNPETTVVPFESTAIEPERLRLWPGDSVMTNAQRLASLPAGGTNCAAPLALLNQRRAVGDLIIYVSDNESWIGSPSRGLAAGQATSTMQEWTVFKRRSPKAKMVCIDIQPNFSSQAPEQDDILNVGGFSDTVFDVIAAVAGGHASREFWVKMIEGVRL